MNTLKNDYVITELYAWVSVDDDGNEGIISLQNENGHYMPLVISRRDLIERVRNRALSGAKDDKIKVRLVKFSHKEILEEIDP